MVKSYIKSAFKNFRKQKGFSFINIIGLGVGIASCILIFLWVNSQLSYDQFHENSKTLYGLSFNDGGSNMASPVSVYLKKNYPQIINSTRFKNSGRTRIQANDKDMMEDGAAFVDPSFLQMFSLNFLKGDPRTALQHPDNIILTRSLARKYFSTQDPMGKTMSIFGEDFKVTGVIADYPTNSHLKFRFLVSFELFKKFGNPNLDKWDFKWHEAYVQLHPEADLNTINKKISRLIQKFTNTESRELLLRPVTRLYLYNLNGGGRITIIIAFSLIAVFVLLIACINFINLSTVQYSIRKKEVGLRKTIGAQRKQLVFQFFIETFIVILLAWMVGMILVKSLIPEFNQLIGEYLSFNSIFNGSFLPGIIGLLLLSGLIAGSYPALYISSFKPVDIFRDKEITGNKGAVLRRGLVIFQFILSIVLIFGSLVLSSQLNHMRNAPLGYDKHQVVTFRTGSRIESHSSFKHSLLGYKDIVHVTGTMIPPFRLNMMAGEGRVYWEGQEHEKTKMVEITVDPDYAKTFGLKIINGRFFSSDRKTDLHNAWVVNETAVNTMGMDSPIGKWLEVLGEKKVIIGVVKDYNFESLQEKIRPMAMKLSMNNQWMCVKIKNNNIPATLEYIKTQWVTHSNNFPFEFHFLDDQINNLYITEERMGTLFKYFGILAIVLSCLGMFGLASFLTQSRTKEIGIRKVLGSKTSGLIFLLAKDFLKWVCYAMIIAWPTAWFLMNKSLQIYAYRIKIGWEFFAVSGGLALIIAVLSIGYQVFKTARINPITALRYK